MKIKTVALGPLRNLALALAAAVALLFATPAASAADEAAHLVGTARAADLFDSFGGALEKRLPSLPVPRGTAVAPLVAGEPLADDFRYAHDGARLGIDDYLARRPITGLLVLKDDKLVLERYAHGGTPATRFLSASMAKSVVGLLVGIALDEGKIRSIDDMARTYVPALAGSAYGDTSIRDLLRMSSGVDFAERYDDRDDLRALINDTIGQASAGGAAVLTRYTARRARPGAMFYYSSADTQALALVLRGATGASVADYFSARIWSPMGAQDTASFLVDASGQEAAFAFMHARLRDYGRLGRLLANQGRAGDRQVVPSSWLASATTVAAPHTQPFVASAYFGYGHHFWVFPGERRQFALIGVRGQVIFVDPALKLVLVQTAVWPTPGDRAARAELLALWEALVVHHAAGGAR
jgi:CubicO group peptidase (beta-lactamase class C family)